MKKDKILLLFALLFIGCTNSTSINNVGDYEVLAKEIQKGNLESYRKMKILCLDYEPAKIIKWAKYAADTLKYAPANLDALEGYLNSNSIYGDTIYLKKIRESDKSDVVKFFQAAKRYKVKGVEKYILTGE